ncbi:MAG: 1-acyl-sn-glycerol-3-phosphate acyltransferase [Alphaproteobacteria bacterium]|nr:1-acyl-sn-glycerol-3-phosphate acyltransferase [Alphaproteobacteria bacterium]
MALLKIFASMLRTRLFEIYVLIFSLLVGVAIPTYLHWTRKPRQVRHVLRAWSWCFIYGARAILGTRFRLEGLENIPDRPVIFVGNHQSYWESIAMTVFFPHINVITKRAAMSIPVFGWGLYHAPMTPVDRGSPGLNIRRIAREGRASIAEGRSILIYPEGGRVPIRERRPFTRGLELLYKNCNAEVVPFVTNAGFFWPKGFATKFPGLITVRFLPPMPPGQDPRAFAAEIERLLNEEKDKVLETAG